MRVINEKHSMAAFEPTLPRVTAKSLRAEVGEAAASPGTLAPWRSRRATTFITAARSAHNDVLVNEL